MEQYMIWIWLAVFVVAIIIEGCTTQLVSIWFSGGALISLILSLIPDVAWWIEVVVFSVVSIALLIILRPFFKKALVKIKTESNVDEIIGKKGKILKPITELDKGEIIINGVIWTALSSNEKVEIAKDEVVKVVAIQGNKLIVEKEK